MKIIADSGSSKTLWMLVSELGLIKSIETEGFNPYYYSIAQLQRMIAESVIPQLADKAINEIVFYGSGCSTEHNCAMVHGALKAMFPETRIFVYHDLLAAAHALLAHKSGIACILGTGSNSCLYNGVQIVANVPSLGFMLADEGSGVYIGKLLITSVLYGEAPEDIRELLVVSLNFSREQVLDAIYRQQRPAAYLAGFAKFVGQHIQHPYCKAIVSKAFDDFIRIHISKYPDFQQYPIAFVGSVAYAFQDILSERLTLAGLKTGSIEANPSNGLVRFHS